MVPRVVDISHYTKVSDMHKTAAAGIWGIICKTTQGTSIIDNSYVVNKKKTLDAGMLWGAYHFATNADPQKQLNFFLAHAQIDDNTLPCLDFEPNQSGEMSGKQMVEFLHLGEKKLGRKFVIYSGNLIKEIIGDLSHEDQLYVCQHKLWLAQYASHATLPKGFKKYFLWQYTGDGAGPSPHSVPGLGGEGAGLDLNVYDGTKEELTAEWIVKKIVTPPTNPPVAEKSSVLQPSPPTPTPPPPQTTPLPPVPENKTTPPQTTITPPPTKPLPESIPPSSPPGKPGKPSTIEWLEEHNPFHHKK